VPAGRSAGAGPRSSSATPSGTTAMRRAESCAAIVSEDVTTRSAAATIRTKVARE
jgi:hypothetical protein